MRFIAVFFHEGDVPMLIFACNCDGYVPPAAKVIVVNWFPKVYAVFATNDVLLTKPVTSPVPIVVADPPMLSVLVPM
jgi:hypothetical protein